MNPKTIARIMVQSLIFILLFSLVSCNLPTATIATEEPAVLQDPGNISIDSHQWYVAVDGDDNNDCHSLAHPCQHITTAVERASDGDSIRIGAGTFFENIRVIKSLAFLGQGMDVTIIDGKGEQTRDGVFWFDGEALAEGPITASISDMTIQNGNSDGYGTNHGAWDNLDGGGIDAVDTNLEMSNVIVRGNKATHSGGGIQFGMRFGSPAVRTLQISNSFIDGNESLGHGGGFFSYSPHNITIIDSVISNNVAKGNQLGYDVKGGGLYLERSKNVSLTRVTINNNTVPLPDAPAGIYSNGDIELREVIIKDNGGAGVWVGDGEIYNSTISGNAGTGIYSVGDLYIENSTISNNHSNLPLAAGIVVWTANAKLRTNHVTIADNAIPGLLQGESGQSELMNTLIAQNTANCVLNSGAAPNGSYNISSDGTCGTHFSVVHDAMIGPLQDNGGSTMTHALLSGSPAIDTGRDGLDFDQRGVSRQQDGDGDGEKHVDIGAYEYERAANQVVFIPNRGLNCRSGPSAAYQVFGFADQDHSYIVEGRNDDASWVYIRQAGDLRCWVSAGNGTLSGDVATVNVITVAPVTPMDITTDIPTPVPAACSSFTAANCPSHCKVGRDPSGARVCVNP